MKKHKSAVVVLSGGQDSVTCLGLALAVARTVRAIAFDYGQRHAVELTCAANICYKHNVPLEIVDVSCLGSIVTSALTGEGSVSAPHAYKPGLPASFVPARNALFLTLAHAYAQERQADALYTGVCQTDYSGYPDCRDTFVRLLATTLNVGYESNIAIRTPMMFLNKAQTFYLADRIGFLDDVLEMSHTCYNGDHQHSHEWGYGCGECPACKIRAAGYAQFAEGNFSQDLVDQLLAS